jgi:hypothetical protein
MKDLRPGVEELIGDRVVPVPSPKMYVTPKAA